MESLICPLSSAACPLVCIRVGASQTPQLEKQDRHILVCLIKQFHFSAPNCSYQQVCLMGGSVNSSNYIVCIIFSSPAPLPTATMYLHFNLSLRTSIFWVSYPYVVMLVLYTPVSLHPLLLLLEIF